MPDTLNVPLRTPFSVWEGVFTSFEEAGGDHDAFTTERWLAKQTDKVIAQHHQLEHGMLGTCKDYPLPLVVAMTLASQPTVSILDFGGGMGSQYLDLLAKVRHARERVTYVVVEGEATLSCVPPEIQKGYPTLSFRPTLDGLDTPFDIVHIGSTLQYIEKWQDLLTRLIQTHHPRYCVLSDLLAGDIPTFVTHQLYYGKRIPVNFISFKECLKILEELSYKLFFKSFFQSDILGSQDLPTTSLPKENRLQKSLNCVFSQ